ncbi:MAG: hypothetical protein GX767_04560 [Firmicutes bacterium]|nr:hypothetical protein [Bacillota bacterium]
MKPKLKLVKSQDKAQKKWFRQSSFSRMLFILTGVVLVQMILGWIWNKHSYSVIETFRVQTGSIETFMPIYGLIIRDESVVFLPRTGYVKPLVEEGKRVPVGKELFYVSSSPLQESGDSDESEEEKGFWESVPVIGGLFDEDTGHEEEEPLLAYEEKILSTNAGVVSFQLDGLEKYGPGNFFYMAQEDLKKNCDLDISENNHSFKGRINRGTPLAKIVDTYEWYFSVVLTEEQGAALGGQVGFYFDFAPQERVSGKLVEEFKKNSSHCFTWEITRELPDFYLHRIAKANLVYAQEEGIMLPLDALVRVEEVTGVYLLEAAGVVRFQEVQVKGKEGDMILVEGIDPNSQVIVNP